MTFRILVTGDRNWKDFDIILEALNEEKPDKVGEGGADGADYWARLACIELKIPYRTFYADWEKRGRAAGPIRNTQMLKLFKPHKVLAFHDKLWLSKGTRDMVEKSVKAGIPVLLFSHVIATNLFLGRNGLENYLDEQT